MTLSVISQDNKTYKKSEYKEGKQWNSQIFDRRPNDTTKRDMLNMYWKTLEWQIFEIYCDNGRKVVYFRNPNKSGDWVCKRNLNEINS